MSYKYVFIIYLEIFISKVSYLLSISSIPYVLNTKHNILFQPYFFYYMAALLMLIVHLDMAMPPCKLLSPHQLLWFGIGMEWWTVVST